MCRAVRILHYIKGKGENNNAAVFGKIGRKFRYSRYLVVKLHKMTHAL